jgi:GNAT superfamily N-acetyltransferase
MSVEFRCARAEDARLLAETRRRAWDTTYRGIYPDAMIDEYDLEAHTALDAARIANPANAVFLAMDGAECVGYFTYGPYTYGRYKDFALCLNSLYFLPGYRRMGLGRRAFAQLTEFCRERGIPKFFCGCNCHNLPRRHFTAPWAAWSAQCTAAMRTGPRTKCILNFRLSKNLPSRKFRREGKCERKPSGCPFTFNHPPQRQNCKIMLQNLILQF